MLYGLKDDTIEKIKSVFVKYYQVNKVVLYGSRAKGNYKTGSDVDLTLYGDALDLSIVSKISNDIDDLLLPYTFDISIFEQIVDCDIIEHINRVGIVFYETNGV
ncbi:MAG: nucleotidyltransferase domain-containing protein [Anaerohalosphaeraceae bacterium]|nr:nucleotidyltransferase domain-containing protein [Anaerohalosphaeraceae bacterium]